MSNIGSTKTMGLILLPLACLFVAGCSQVGREFASYDKFTSSGMSGVRVQDPGVPCIYTPFTVQLDLIRLQEPGKRDRFGFRANIVTTYKNIWANRIILLSDGHPIEMSGTSKLDDVRVDQSGTKYYEEAVFMARPDQLQDLAGSQTLEFRIYGARGAGPSFGLKEKSLQAIRLFYDRYVTRQMSMN